MKPKTPITVFILTSVATLFFVSGIYFGKARSQPKISSLKANLRSTRIKNSNIEMRAASTMRKAIISLRSNRNVEIICRDLNFAIDLLLVHQTDEIRQGIPTDELPEKLTFKPYDTFWFQVAYEIRKDREVYPVSYEDTKWESMISSCLETDGSILIKRGTDRTTDSTVPSQGAPSDVQ